MIPSSLISGWKILGSCEPKSLQPAISQIHHGVQFISMVGRHFIENKPDDSHTNMEWIESEEVLAGHWIKAPKGDFRVAMKPADLELIIYDAQMQKAGKCSLDGITNVQACRWLEAHLDRFGENSDKMNLLLHYEIPDHETDEGAAYQLKDQHLFAEMARYRADSNLVLKHFASQYENASPVRTWPHHFDNGSYIPLVFDDEGEALKSFSIGMGIPDEASDEPYFYITTWSREGDNAYNDLEELPAGKWISDPFNGAVIRASEIICHKTAEGQVQCVFDFLGAGIKASQNILK
jgi:hypothetical protein